MAENYVVNYDINVRSQAAIQALTNFQQATNKLSQAGKQLTAFQKKIEAVTNKLNQMSRKAPVLDIATSKVNKKLDATIAKLEKIHRLAKKTAALNVTTGAAPVNNSRTSHSATVSRHSSRTSRPISFSRATINKGIAKDISYQLLGHTPLDTGGTLGMDFLKGMGIAYGIAGAGSLISKVVSEATEYDNLMQTAKNILGTHDKQANFLGRFNQMAQTVRNVGVETKYTAPQVADAAKFLAMAGFDINAINQSIRPIADIALVGDTDLGETADVVTNIMTGYGISPDRVRKAADIMTMTFTKSNTTLMEIAEAYKYSASLLSAGGVDFEEATAAMGILGDAGIKGSQAGTTMRTIMANIVNPTKKQLANWERIGVSRTDAYGRVRPLVEIFKDLSEAGLYVDDFYKLFHKTAAQGAVSLANGVDKWNDIIKENFMSDGVTKELADAKKNTIAGLWAQLTSMFTEDGMVAFEAVQQPIKDFLNEIITWLKQPEAVELIKELAVDLLDFMHMIKDVTKTFLEWYKIAKPFIKFWVELQLKMMPVIAGLRIFKASLLGVSGIIQFAGRITFLTGKFVALARSLKAVRTAGGFMGMWNAIGGNLINSVRSYFLGNYYNGILGRDIKPEVLQRYLSMKRHASRSSGIPIIPGRSGSWGGIAKAGIGGLVGGFAGSEIGEAFGGENGAMWGSLLGGAAGLGLLMMGGPVGWIGAGVIAVGGLIAALYNSHVEAKKAQKAFDDFASSVKMVDGVLSGDNLTSIEKYLEIVYSKQLSLNDVIERRIELLKMELGLQDPSKVQSNESSITLKVFEEAIKTLDATDSIWGSGTMAKNASNLANLISRKSVMSTSGQWYWYEAVHGHSVPINNPDGSNDAQDALAAMAALYREGATGTEQAKIKEEFQKRLSYILTHGGSWEDILAVKNDWANRYGKWTYSPDTYPDQFAYGLDDISSWDVAKVSSSYTYRQGLYDVTKSLYGPQAEIWRIAENYWDAVQAGSISESQVIDYMSLMDEKLGTILKDYTLESINQWARSLGYWDGTFHALNGHPASTVAITTRSALDTLLETLSRLSTPAQDATRELFGFATQLRGIANGYIYSTNGGKPINVKPSKEGDVLTLDGVKYTYHNGMWDPEFGNGTGPLMSIPDEQMQNNLAARGNNTSMDNTTNSPNTTNPGGKSSDYKSHYNNNSAAPKQVIVKIENLMNVESVDLSNPDNAAVIADLKGQLTQALVDVVHDFDETYHG